MSVITGVDFGPLELAINTVKAERDELRKEVERLVARVKELETALKDIASELEDAERWACCIEARDQKQATYRGNAFRSVQRARVQAQTGTK